MLQNAQKLQKLVVYSETSQRGFIITGNEDFLEPYNNGINNFQKLIKIEKKLVSDNPTQVEKLEIIEELFQDWNTKATIPEIEMARIVHQSTINTKDLESLISQGTGKGILDEIRETIVRLNLNLDAIDNVDARIISFAVAKGYC